MTSVTFWLLPLNFLILTLIGNSFALKCYVCENIVPWCVTPECAPSLVGSNGVCISVWEIDASAGTSKRAYKNCGGSNLNDFSGGPGKCAVLKGSKFVDEVKKGFPKTKEEMILQFLNGPPDTKQYWLEIIQFAKIPEVIEAGADPDDYKEKPDIDPEKMYEVCTCTKDLCNPGEARKYDSGAMPTSGMFGKGKRAIVTFAVVSCILAYGF